MAFQEHHPSASRAGTLVLSETSSPIRIAAIVYTEKTIEKRNVLPPPPRLDWHSGETAPIPELTLLVRSARDLLYRNPELILVPVELMSSFER